MTIKTFERIINIFAIISLIVFVWVVVSIIEVNISRFTDGVIDYWNIFKFFGLI